MGEIIGSTPFSRIKTSDACDVVTPIAHNFADTLPRPVGTDVKKNSTILPLRWKKLEELSLEDVSLNTLPVSVCTLKALKSLRLVSDIEELLPEIGQFNQLKLLRIEAKLKTLPSEISQLKQLEEHHLSDALPGLSLVAWAFE